jgi:hypothetical protein
MSFTNPSTTSPTLDKILPVRPSCEISIGVSASVRQGGCDALIIIVVKRQHMPR